MTGPRVEVRYVHADDGVRLALTVIAPRAPTRGGVLLLHGFSQNRKAFLHGEIPRRLANRGLVVVVGELRGHGLSDRPRLWTLQDHFERDVPRLARAAAELGGGRPHLVAHSMGGLLGYASLARSPPWASLTAIAAPIELGRGSPLVGWAARAVAPAVRFAGDRPVPMDRFLGALSGPLSARRAELWALQQVVRLANPQEAEEAILREVLRSSDPESMAVFRACLGLALRRPAGLCGVDLEAAIRRTSLPVALIVGGWDIFAPPPSVACLERGAQAGPRRLLVLPRASHVDLTVGARVAQAVEGLLGFLEVP